MKIKNIIGFVLSSLFLISVAGPLFSKEGPSQNNRYFYQIPVISVENPFSLRGLQQFSGQQKLQKIHPKLNDWKIAPPAIWWKAVSRWRSIQEIYIFKHRIYNELIQSKKRLNLA